MPRNALISGTMAWTVPHAPSNRVKLFIFYAMSTDSHFTRVDRGEPMTRRTVALDLRIQDYTADQIRKIRRALNVSQAVMARLLGVSPLTIQAWE